MELSGSHLFGAPCSVVYAVLTDPDTLRRCLPGCQKFDPTDDGGYHITMSIGIAAIKGAYSGTVHMLDGVPPESYTLKMSARGAVGFVDGSGDFILAPADGDTEKTLLKYTGTAQVGGKIAGLGQRVIHSGANLVIGQFFKALEKEVARQQTDGSAEA